MTDRQFEQQANIAKICIETMQPTQGKCPEIIENQFQFRKNNKFVGENLVVIGDMKEAVWWNRPQIEDTEAAWGEHKGMPCCNLPISFGKSKTWKSNYNILLNKNNIPTIVQLQFNHILSIDELNRLKHMSFAIILNTLKKLKVKEEDLCVLNNDLMLKGKKFIGSEQVYRENVYTECIYITLKYLEEKNLFDQLTSGKVSATAHKQITGLIDEYPTITKEDFLKIYCEEFKKYLDQFEL